MGARPPAKPFRLLLKEGALFLGEKEFLVIETPGHSPGSICLYMKKEKALIAGDTIFSSGVGRTDLPGGDTESPYRQPQEARQTGHRVPDPRSRRHAERA